MSSRRPTRSASMPALTIGPRQRLLVEHDADVDGFGEALVPVDDRLACSACSRRRREHHCDRARFPRGLCRARREPEVRGMDAGDDRELAVGAALRAAATTVPFSSGVSVTYSPSPQGARGSRRSTRSRGSTMLRMFALDRLAASARNRRRRSRRSARPARAELRRTAFQSIGWSLT